MSLELFHPIRDKRINSGWEIWEIGDAVLPLEALNQAVYLKFLTFQQKITADLLSLEAPMAWTSLMSCRIIKNQSNTDLKPRQSFEVVVIQAKIRASMKGPKRIAVSHHWLWVLSTQKTEVLQIMIVLTRDKEWVLFKSIRHSSKSKSMRIEIYLTNSKTKLYNPKTWSSPSKHKRNQEKKENFQVDSKWLERKDQRLILI